MPKFSIVIACYNAAATLHETLQSVQAQTETDWEAICVDDGSTDRTLAILLTASNDDPRIRIIAQDNAGPSRARNAGVDLARGTWIAFLDADDLWLPEKLAIVRDVICKTPSADAVFGKIGFFETRDHPDTTVSTVREGTANLADLLGENPICTFSNLCVRKDVYTQLGGLNTEMRYSEDLEFAIRLVANGFSLVGTDTLLIRYRASNDGLSANLMQMHDGWRQAILSAGVNVTPQQRARAEALHLRYLARRALRLGLPGYVSATIALKGLLLAPRSFLGDRHRGIATLVCSLAAPVLPSTLRRALFT